MLADLPAGVALSPGQITVRFTTTEDALEKLLSLAMVIGNDLERFEQAVGVKDAVPESLNLRVTQD